LSSGLGPGARPGILDIDALHFVYQFLRAYPKIIYFKTFLDSII